MSNATPPSPEAASTSDEEQTYPVKHVLQTVQGEGFWVGRPAVFVRLVGCNVGSGSEADRERDGINTTQHSGTPLEFPATGSPASQ